MSRYLILVAAVLVVAAVEADSVAAVSPEQAASYCYEQAKKMGFSSRDTEDRSWEDCMGQFHRPAQPPPADLTPEQRAFLLQQPAANPGLEAGRGMLRGLCLARRSGSSGFSGDRPAGRV